MQIDMFETEGMMLARLRADWTKAIEGNGGHCPCCGRWGKVYTQRLTQSMALALRWIMVHGEQDGWVQVQERAPRWMMRGKTYSLLEHWGLIESKAHRSGVWRATHYGQDFVLGHCEAHAAVHVYDNKVWGLSAETVKFRDCFGKDFDFDLLMSDRYDWSVIQ